MPTRGKQPSMCQVILHGLAPVCICTHKRKVVFSVHPCLYSWFMHEKVAVCQCSQEACRRRVGGLHRLTSHDLLVGLSLRFRAAVVFAALWQGSDGVFLCVCLSPLFCLKLGDGVVDVNSCLVCLHRDTNICCSRCGGHRRRAWKMLRRKPTLLLAALPPPSSHRRVRPHKLALAVALPLFEKNSRKCT